MVAAILGDRGQDAAAEPDRRAVHVPDREDHPLPEAVVHPAPGGLTWLGEARLDELVGADLALRGERSGQGVPTPRRVAELVRRDRRIREAASAQVVERGLARLRAREDRVVEGDRALGHVPKPRLAGVLAARPLVELHAGLRGENLEGLAETQPV